MSSGYMLWRMKPGGLPGIKEFQIAHSPKKRFSKLQVLTIDIDETMRGQGLGRSAYIAVEKWAVKHGCEVVELESMSQAIGFWLRLGFEPIKMNFDGYLVMRRDTAAKGPKVIVTFEYDGATATMFPLPERNASSD